MVQNIHGVLGHSDARGLLVILSSLADCQFSEPILTVSGICGLPEWPGKALSGLQN